MSSTKSISTTAAIQGIGTAVPEFRIDQWDAADQALKLSSGTPHEERVLTTLYRRCGVAKRHSVILESSTNGRPADQSFFPSGGNSSHGPTTAARMEAYERRAGDLAADAARQALSEAGIAPDEVTHLVTVSCSGFSAPGIDLSLVRDLRLPPNTCRTHLGFMGCHGALNGLRVAKAFADADPAACVLLCAVELCTLHHQYGFEADQVVANALFGDGAAAAVIGRGAGSADGWQLVDVGSTVIADTAQMMSWRIGDHGFQMTLSPSVPQLIERSLRPWLTDWLSGHDLTVDQIGSWAVHPGGPRIVEACCRAVGADPESRADSLGVLAEFGNMSSPTVLFVLDRLRRRNAPRPCVALAFGPGVVIEAALLE